MARSFGRFLLLAAVGVLLLSCSTDGSRDVGAAKPGQYKVGKPYQIKGVWYYPNVNYDYVETGVASWYGRDFHGKKTANGEIYDMNLLTAAHRTLPLPSMVRVTNLENGRQIKLRVNDRGPYAHGRIIDLSRRAAQLLGFDKQGTARVKVEIMADESRQLAMLATGGAEPTGTAAALSSVTAAPTTAMGTEALESLPGAKVATTQSSAGLAEDPVPVQPAGSSLNDLPKADGTITVVPTKQTQLFIQAGAFTNVSNANRLRAKLAAYGPSRVVPAFIGQQRFYRVQLGPIATVADADATLEMVLAAGHPEARLVVQ